MRKILFIGIIAIAAFSCKDDQDARFEKSFYTIYYDGEVQPQLIVPDGENVDTYNYHSEDEHVFTVSSSGLVSGEYVGEADMIASEGNITAKCRIVVVPYEKLFTAPILPIMNHLTMEGLKKAEVRTLKSETENSLIYAPNAYDLGIDSLKYSFENNVLVELQAFVQSDVEENRIKLFLTERYASIGSTETYSDHNTNAVVSYKEAENAIVYSWEEK